MLISEVEQLCAGSNTWPVTTGHRAVISEDREWYLRRLLEDAPRLFTADGTRVEFMRLKRDSHGVTTESDSLLVTSLDTLHDALRAENIDHSNSFIIIQQDYSWGRFLVTRNLFQRILKFHNVFAPYLDSVHAFGFKVDEDDNVWSGFRRRVKKNEFESGRTSLNIELCYNVQYVENNGRTVGGPWSLRQMGVYQQFDDQTQKSTWILLQPSADVRRLVGEALKERAKAASWTASHPMAVHLLFLFSTAKNWGRYIEDLGSALRVLDEKACFSKVGRKQKYDYSVNFSDGQKLQLLRQKLLRAVSILDSCLMVAEGCQTCGGELAILNRPYCSREIDADFHTYAAQIRYHRGNLATILKSSSGTAKLLHKILEYRNDEAIHNAGLAMQENLEHLNRITFHSQQQNEHMGKLAGQAQKDSQTLKALTLVATMYLPATLLATVFSSNLVQLVGNGHESDADSHFVITKQFWVYVVITVPLMAFTLGSTLWLRRW